MTVRILICSDSTTDAEYCRTLLANLPNTVFITTNRETRVADFYEARPGLVVLAFRDTAAAERYYLELYCACKMAQAQLHQTLVVCSQETMDEVYASCEKQHYDDCVEIWPHTTDGAALRLAVGRAEKALQKADTQTALAEKMRRHIKRIADLDQPLELPRKHTDPGSPTGATAGNVSVVSRQGAPKILIVDDDYFQYRIHQRLFAAEPYELLIANSAIDAFAQLRRQTPAAIIMDYDLPAINGMEAVRRMRRVPRLNKVPVIMLTGKSDKSLVNDCLLVGATDFIVKPFKRDMLLAKVRKYIGETRSTAVA